MSRYKCEIGQRVSVVATFKQAKVQGNPGTGVSFVFVDPLGNEHNVAGTYEGVGTTTQVRGEYVVDMNGIWWVRNTAGSQIIATDEDWFTVSPHRG
jgi:hypothetical protein